MKARALSDLPDIPLPAGLPPQRAGIQSVEVGFGLLQVLAQAQGSLMLRRDLAARAVNTLLPGVAGFCAPVFDADGHLALGMVALGSGATFDTAWDGAVAVPLKAAAARLSDELGFAAT